MKENELFYNCSQIAWPIGDNKDSLSISTFIYLDTNTNITTVKPSTVILNWSSSKNNRELFTGTYKECYNYIQDYIELEG